jgi:hypothetical protein
MSGPEIAYDTYERIGDLHMNSYERNTEDAR